MNKKYIIITAVIVSLLMAACKDLFDEFEIGGNANTYGLYVSGANGSLEAAGNDANEKGTSEDPFATLERAVSYIKASSEIANWEIFIDGKVSGETEISDINAVSVSIIGLNNNNLKDVLEGTNSASVLAVKTSAKIKLENIRITKGKGTLSGGDLLGGGLYIEQGSVEAKNCTIINNGTAGSVLGGGIYIGSDCSLSLSGSTIDSNGSAAASGGGIYNAGNLTISGNASNIIAENTAENGGGIYNALPTANFTLSGEFEITVNIVSGMGGGIYNAGTFKMIEPINAYSSINGNEAGYGGGVYSIRTFIMEAGSISSNKVTISGGGVYNTRSFTMSGGCIDGNYMELNSADGGGVYNSGTMEMYGSAVIGDKEAEYNAGDSDASNNAWENGGGIYNAQNASLSLGSSDSSKILTGGIYFNFANIGGGIYNLGTCNIYSGNVDYNGSYTDEANGIYGTYGNYIDQNTYYIQDD